MKPFPLATLLAAFPRACVSGCVSPASATLAAADRAGEVSTSASPQWINPLDPPTYVTATGRIVASKRMDRMACARSCTPHSCEIYQAHFICAVGDLHGDLDKAVEALKLGRVIRVSDEGEVAWVGSDTVVVQLGDVLDRGDVEIGIINLLRYLDSEARKCGGAVYMLNGNHESLNVCGDFRYVTPGAFAESAMYAGLKESDLKDWQLVAKVRYSLFKPGGDLAKEFARNPTVLVVNDTVFAHGGLLPIHVEYGIERLNSEVAAWMRGDQQPDGSKCTPPFLAMGDANSVMWNRTLSKERFATPYERYHACRALQQALAKVHGKRLVVGHTPQLSGVNCECENQVWRIDVGMSYGVLNRPVQVLEITQHEGGEAEVRIIRSTPTSSQSSYDDDDLSAASAL
ncbi:hypothetical protein VOLCADRAFT_87011 [Volvox carteri f. nagariensis]|uniref:Calcineurin-like phosphoesterase domain-containing protein n=1 Tax=Volvox carteri f. nagariensis TaxID=3068 RepID=D8TJY1_VOLCA|nr:uncharacterized protein VOLCADRAFT_87011 [Volvox carteri f. nagariensis]EFJ51968.1 hypothetical protein VOLCADRAFT_87011 [Volvox carteri f. nagariensis]|eukprot:XP_002946742.1 hypothetical protein VOLCADRAFT_87011 [Volvox carteri f. nagariensis]